MAKGDGAGRPSVINPETLRKLEEAFALGCTDNEACCYADIGKTALYEYQIKNPKFTERKETLKQRPVLLARSELVKGLKGNPELALKYLERKLKSEFSLRTELTGADGKDLVNTLNSLETDYGDLGQKIAGQSMALNPPVQDKGQAGEISDIFPEPDTTQASS